jgi:ParB-like chromosome segregation protein Spo0J
MRPIAMKATSTVVPSGSSYGPGGQRLFARYELESTATSSEETGDVVKPMRLTAAGPTSDDFSVPAPTISVLGAAEDTIRKARAEKRSLEKCIDH